MSFLDVMDIKCNATDPGNQKYKKVYKLTIKIFLDVTNVKTDELESDNQNKKKVHLQV